MRWCPAKRSLRKGRERASIPGLLRSSASSSEMSHRCFSSICPILPGWEPCQPKASSSMQSGLPLPVRGVLSISPRRYGSVNRSRGKRSRWDMGISQSFFYHLYIPSGPPDIHSLCLAWLVPIFAWFAFFKNRMRPPLLYPFFPKHFLPFPRIPTGETPFVLTYGAEALVPVGVAESSPL